MFRTLATASILIAGVLSGCATKPLERPINASLVLWPKGADRDCDFEAPRRDESRAAGYSPTPRSVPLRGQPLISQGYAVRNAQMRQRPVPGEVLCLVVSRGPIDRATALVGFEVKAVTTEDFDVVPVRARVHRAAFGSPSDIALSVGLATLSFAPPSARPAALARFDLGVVPTDGRMVNLTLPAQRLRWPATSDELDILRMDAIVLEATPGAAASIRDEDLAASLTRPREG